MRAILPVLLATAPAAPLSWLGWEDAAFEKARREQKAILLVVVEAAPGSRAALGEALADEETVSLVRGGFVGVEVEREVRPDIAEIYSSALVLMEEQGRPELPLAVALTPEGRPLAGTSLRREGRGAAAALKGLLLRVASDYGDRRAELEAEAGLATLALREAQRSGGRGGLRVELVERARRGLLESFDPLRARFGLAPGPPPPGALRFLFAEHVRTGRPEPLSVAIACLASFARSGLPDRTGGAPCLAPNALLHAAYVRAHALTGEAVHAEGAARIADWALETMRRPGGGFRSCGPRAGSGDDAADDRVFVGANGLMIGALARSGSHLERRDDLDAARASASFVLERLGPAPALARYGLGEDRHGSAFLEDHALLAEGLLDLYEATTEPRWRKEAEAVAEAALARFLDTEAGGFFETDGAHEPLIVRLRNGYDGVLPAGNGVMASVLLRLSRASGETRYQQLARRTLEAFVGDLEEAPRGLETLAAAAGELLGRPAAAALAEPLPSRAAAGPVEVAVAVSPSRARPGGPVEARVRLKIAGAWRVNAHRAGAGLVGLSISVPAGALSSAPRYPEGRPGRWGPDPAHVGEVDVPVGLRVPANATPGPIRLRLRVAFQACRERECAAPASVLLEVPLLVSAP